MAGASSCPRLFFVRILNEMKHTLFLLVTFATFASAASQTFTGIITDSMCPDGDHSDMKEKSAAECVRKCMQGMKGMSYVLWDGKTTWTLSDQKTPAKYPAQKVTIVGTAGPKTHSIQVTSITPAK